MTTRRVAALAAVFTRLQTLAGPTVSRGEVLPEAVPAGGLVNLREGEPTEVDETLGVVTRHWAERLELELVVQAGDGAARAAALDDLTSAVAAALAIDPGTGGDPTLGGTVDHARLMPLERVDDLAIPGAAALKAAILAVALDYTTGPNPMEVI